MLELGIVYEGWDIEMTLNYQRKCPGLNLDILSSRDF